MWAATFFSVFTNSLWYTDVSNPPPPPSVCLFHCAFIFRCNIPELLLNNAVKSALVCGGYKAPVLTYLYLCDTTLLPEQPKVWENTRTRALIFEGCNTRHTRRTCTHRINKVARSQWRAKIVSPNTSTFWDSAQRENAFIESKIRGSIPPSRLSLKLKKSSQQLASVAGQKRLEKQGRQLAWLWLQVAKFIYQQLQQSGIHVDHTSTELRRLILFLLATAKTGCRDQYSKKNIFISRNV